MFDDFSLLQKLFRDDLQVFIQEVHMFSKPQVVALSSFWSEELMAFFNQLSDPVCIITCAIEAAIRSRINLVGCSKMLHILVIM